MSSAKFIPFCSDKKKLMIDASRILCVVMRGNNAEIITADGESIVGRMTMLKLEELLGDEFIKIHRGCLVSVQAIHEVSDKVYLCNGMSLGYAARKKKDITAQLYNAQKQLFGKFRTDDIPSTDEEYRAYYAGMEHLPFAFTDIEMVFNDELHAIDWIFRYGNPALAKLEKLPLDKLIGNSFSKIFPSMDSKWLRSYEQSALYGKTLELMDYSPEIDTYLKVICFPTFSGHCGCILFNISDIELARSSSDADKALMLYLGNKNAADV